VRVTRAIGRLSAIDLYNVESRSHLVVCFQEAHRAIGAPGDWGYGEPEGDAVKAVYDAYNAFATATKPQEITS
jgi:hypothetical protein